MKKAGREERNSTADKQVSLAQEIKHRSMFCFHFSVWFSALLNFTVSGRLRWRRYARLWKALGGPQVVWESEAHFSGFCFSREKIGQQQRCVFKEATWPCCTGEDFHQLLAFSQQELSFMQTWGQETQLLMSKQTLEYELFRVYLNMWALNQTQKLIFRTQAGFSWRALWESVIEIPNPWKKRLNQTQKGIF